MPGRCSAWCRSNWTSTRAERLSRWSPSPWRICGRASGGARGRRRLFQPIATHNFLNVRTYVIHNGEPGIHFLAEWLSNRLAVALGPVTFGLPYHHGHLAYNLSGEHDELHGTVANARDEGPSDFQRKI